MKRSLLLCSFEPFLRWKNNSSTELASHVMARHPRRTHMSHLVLPVCYIRAGEEVVERIRNDRPSIVLCMWQHGRAKSLLLERVALNMAHSSYRDSKGVKKYDELIHGNAPPARWTTIPHGKLMSLVQQHRLPLKLSFHAGTYVCNNVLYMALHSVAREELPVMVGFIHVPPIRTSQKGRLSLESLSDTLSRVLDFLSGEEELW